MALPIRPTPVLTGKDADRFEKIIKNGKKTGPIPTPNLKNVIELIKNNADKK
ncbi:MAG: hypothetical protein KAI72_05820 [Candidatus Pacebacteria bacterium]|nr:hypothetical protein [Candidatus Paceibacterota bacterium]